MDIRLTGLVKTDLLAPPAWRLGRDLSTCGSSKFAVLRLVLGPNWCRDNTSMVGTLPDFHDPVIKKKFNFVHCSLFKKAKK